MKYQTNSLHDLCKKQLSDEITDRMCSIILLEKKPNAQPFLCVSWHGPYRTDIEKRKNVLFDLIPLLQELSWIRNQFLLFLGEISM